MTCLWTPPHVPETFQMRLTEAATATFKSQEEELQG